MAHYQKCMLCARLRVRMHYASIVCATVIIVMMACAPGLISSTIWRPLSSHPTSTGKLMMRVSLLAKAPAIYQGTLRINTTPEAKVHTPSRLRMRRHPCILTPPANRRTAFGPIHANTGQTKREALARRTSDLIGQNRQLMKIEYNTFR